MTTGEGGTVSVLKHLSQFALLVLFAGGLGACSSMSTLPDEENVTVSREKAKDQCEEIGKVRGSTSSIKGKAEEALADMKQEAANKGANYVQVMQYSAQQTSVTGLAYRCP